MSTNTWLLAICLTLALAVAAIITGCERGATDAAPTNPPATATAPDAPAIPDDLPDLAPPTCAPGDACATGGVELLPEPTEPDTETGVFSATRHRIPIRQTIIVPQPGSHLLREIELPVGTEILIVEPEAPSKKLIPVIVPPHIDA